MGRANLAALGTDFTIGGPGGSPLNGAIVLGGAVAPSALAVPCTGRAASPCVFNALTNESGTSRLGFVMQFTGHGLQLGFLAAYTLSGVETPLPNTLQLTASIEYPSGATPFRCTFAGQGSITIPVSSGIALWACTDPLDIDIPDDQFFYVQTWALPGNSPNGILGLGYAPDSVYAGDGSNYASGGASDTTGTGGAKAAATTMLFGPAAIIAVPYLSAGGVKPKLTTVGIKGASREAGWGDYPPEGGWVRRSNGWLPFTSQGNNGAYDAAEPSSTLQNDALNGTRARMLPHSLCNNLFTGTQNSGDIANGRTLAQMKADMISAWTMAAGRRCQTIWEATKPPFTTSTDGFTTASGQSTGVTEVGRKALNGWLRAGAPMLNGAAVIAGTPGASTAAVYGASGQLVQAPAGPPHLLAGVLDVDLVADPPQVGVWRTDTVRVVTDAVTTANGSTVSSATANFTSADLYSMIYAAGSDTTPFYWIGAVNSSTQVTVASQMPPSWSSFTHKTTNAVSGARCGIGLPCMDGQHPSPTLAALIEACVPLAALASS